MSWPAVGSSWFSCGIRDRIWVGASRWYRLLFSYSTDHFKTQHSRLSDGRFIVPLPERHGALRLDESRSQAVRRFISFERPLRSRGHFGKYEAVIDEYFQSGPAKQAPASDLEKSTQRVFHLPMHAIRKESSTTTKVRAAFDASAKSQTGVSLNDILLVGPTVTSPLINYRHQSHVPRCCSHSVRSQLASLCMAEISK